MLNVELVLPARLVSWVHLLPVAHCKVEYWVLELGIMQIINSPVQICGLIQVHDLFLEGVHLIEIQVRKEQYSQLEEEEIEDTAEATRDPCRVV